MIDNGHETTQKHQMIWHYIINHLSSILLQKRGKKLELITSALWGLGADKDTLTFSPLFSPLTLINLISRMINADGR